MRFSLFLLFFLTISCSGNVWDNLFSETEASSPIILSESLSVHFPFTFKDYDL